MKSQTLDAYKNLTVVKHTPIKKREPLGSVKLTTDELRFVLHHGHLAPSAENNQPWVFKKAGDRLEFYLKLSEDEKSFDVGGAMAKLSLGACLENIKIVSENLGFKTHLELYKKSSVDKIQATLSWSQSKTLPHELMRSIAERWTDRFPYSKREIDLKTLNDLRSSALENDLLSVDILPRSKKLELAASCLKNLDAIRFSMAEENAHLLKQLRSKEEEFEKKDGISIESTGGSKVDQWILSFIKKYKCGRVLSTAPVVKVLAKKTEQTILESGALVMFSVEEKDMGNEIAWGQTIQNFWLRATHLGLSAQPLYSAVHFPYLAKVLPHKFSKKHKALIQKSQKQLFESFNIKDEQRKCVFLFRLGHPIQKRIPSARKSVEIKF